ncbi:MAG: hypothetical protein Q9N02_06770, partial [Ghiorsea sp.]|nr:hypothetical protein [Ghiorsea sp.]
MKISKIILEKLKDNNVAYLFFQQFQAYAFDSERNCIHALNSTNMLHQLGNQDYLLMPDMDNQLLQLPFPYDVPLAKFKPLESLDARSKIFGKLHFEAVFSQEALSLFYNGQKVYEEPVF